MSTAENTDLDDLLAIHSLYMVFCTALLPLILIGISLFYSGLTQRRSSFTMLIIPTLLSPIVFIDWFIWGYSLCYATASNRFIGSLKFAVLRQLRDPSTLTYKTTRGEILSVLHFLFNGLMKLICVCLTFPGCIAERGRILPMLVFLFFWSCMIYNPVTYWFWNMNGWLSTQLDYIPVLDFAGGNCIHVISGFTGLAYSYLLGPRNPKILYNYRSSNNGHIVIGTVFIICGWCGFIGGCDFKFSSSAIYIFINTILCCFVSAIVWMGIDFYFSAIPLGSSELASESTKNEGNASFSQHNGAQTKLSDVSRKRKFSMISFSSGAMTGLVVMTPAGGFISSPTEFWKPFVFGVAGGAIGNLATRLKYYFNIDDAFDLFAIHGVSGMVSSIMVAIFANDQYGSPGGWVKGNWIQLGHQLAGTIATAVYLFVMSLFFLYIIDIIPGLHLRVDKDFNKRVRREQTKQKDGEDIELQSSPGNLDSHITNSDITSPNSSMNVFEKAEILGSDWYEFNGEYNADFMEFIKVINPEDYPNNEESFSIFGEHDTISEHYRSPDYDLHSGEQQLIRKRE
ncbi:Rh-like protein/ammonium transporter [Hyphopichia burtonii NRRL Y-1933]|uniref:Rh-like protein/ammonium transporter n=1 Tax=Hyphopichia burtonii NRRL Y-1933 TaxID=984485 RepID=A0A1E4RNP4_9ASCO|nr:Rh-like protein/ammonium transporter [Hyphopichia burtonii NRRL Y-1933]ODV68898.1 Rh-like protein/ammonium transporter [Hyphopichia burtonii NRRL Y-1933]